MFTIPPQFAADTIQREGENGRKWLAELPQKVKSLCADWQLTLDGHPMHGYFGLVLPVCRSNVPCILKVTWINKTTALEPIALAAWNGQGAVKLLDHNATEGALLLERLNQHHSLNDLPIEEAIPLSATLLARLAIPNPNTAIPSQQAMVADIINSLHTRWQQYGQSIPPKVIHATHDLAQQYAPTSGNCLVNYDLHYLNVLAGQREPWLAVDPKVVIADPEFGFAQLLFCRLEDIEANGGLDHHFNSIIKHAQLNEELAWAWTIVRCVDYWLWALSMGYTEDPARCARIVNWLLKK